jgi:uncharacterized protein (TIGR02466 family)|tara:strand:+ start:523 stop:1140 length:618 start_codon:yes stop_codon:yes gene_type:complete
MDAEVFPLFSTPVLATRIEVDRDIVRDVHYTPYANDNAGYGSANKKILLEDKFSTLKAQIEGYIDYYLYEALALAQGTAVHASSWINLHRKGDYAVKHMHPNSFVSGVLYLNLPENGGGKIYLHSPQEVSTFKTCTLDPMIKDYNILNSKTWNFHPEEGLLLLFPSHLSHSTDTNVELENRYSLAFNYFMKGALGDDATTSYLEL